MKKWLALVVAALLALAVYVAAGPYRTVHAIGDAIERQDAAALSKQVDFPALRGSLKAQLTDRLVRGAGDDVQASALGAIGLSIAGGLVGGVVDTMVTPLGLGAIMEGRKVGKRFTDTFSPAPAGTTARKPFADAVYRYESASRFTATVGANDPQPVVFVVTRDGLRWRLSDIRLPR
jgi:predicted small secreted protein